MTYTEISGYPHPNVRWYNATLASGTIDIVVPFDTIFSVSWTEYDGDDTPVTDSVCWSFDSATRTITITSSNGSSTANYYVRVEGGKRG